MPRHLVLEAVVLGHHPLLRLFVAAVGDGTTEPSDGIYRIDWFQLRDLCQKPFTEMAFAQMLVKVVRSLSDNPNIITKQTLKRTAFTKVLLLNNQQSGTRWWRWWPHIICSHLGLDQLQKINRETFSTYSGPIRIIIGYNV
jgi:hypothetical protein